MVAKGMAHHQCPFACMRVCVGVYAIGMVAYTPTTLGVGSILAGCRGVGLDSWPWRFVCLVSPSVAVLPVAPCQWLRQTVASVGRCSSCRRGGSCRGRVARSVAAHGWLQGGGWFVACRPRFVGVAVRVSGVASGGGSACHSLPMVEADGGQHWPLLILWAWRFMPWPCGSFWCRSWMFAGWRLVRSFWQFFC